MENSQEDSRHINDVIELNRRACQDLLRIGTTDSIPTALSPRLIFPEYRNEDNGQQKSRISEQESRLVFCNLLNRTQYFYSIETPTNKTYQESGNYPLSAQSDLSLYWYNGERINKLINIEFKANNCSPNSILKDMKKLIKEPEDGNWFHTLKNIYSDTLGSLFSKFIDAVAKCAKDKDLPDFNSIQDKKIAFCFCVLEKNWACSKTFSFKDAAQSGQSVEKYAEEFFKFEYSVSRDHIELSDANGWGIYSAERTID